MRRPIPLLFASFALLAGACAGDDTAENADAASETTETTDPGTATTDTSDTTGTTDPGTATITTDASGETAATAPDDCEDEPDPAVYVEGETPPAIRPCELPTALEVTTIRSGNGREAAVGDTLIVDYTGIRSEDGVVFDDSYSRGVPIDFPLGRGGVIQGWDQGLVGAQAGSLVRLDIPADLAYGDAPPGGDIRAGDPLTFILEVRAVVPPSTAADAPLDLQIEPSVGATETTATDVTIGDGEEVGSGDTAILHLLLVRGDNEIVLFNTWEQGDPIQVIMQEGESIPGLVDGMLGARVGGTRVLNIPPEEAFGPQGEAQLGLPPDTDLIVVAEVVGVY